MQGKGQVSLFDRSGPASLTATDHHTRECPKLNDPDYNPLPPGPDYICHRCGSKGMHLGWDCPNIEPPRRRGRRGSEARKHRRDESHREIPQTSWGAERQSEFSPHNGLPSGRPVEKSDEGFLKFNDEPTYEWSSEHPTKFDYTYMYDDKISSTYERATNSSSDQPYPGDDGSRHMEGRLSP